MTDAVIDDRGNEEFNNAFDEFSKGPIGEDNGLTDDINTASESAGINDSQQEAEEKTPDEVAQLRQQLDTLKQERDHFEHSFKSQVGRVSALQKKLDGEKKEEPEDNDDDVKSLLEDYPEIATPIIKAMEKKFGKVLGEVDQRLAPIQEQEDKRYIASQLAILNDKFPDWVKTVHSQEYNDWLTQQPTAVQSLDGTIHANEMAYLLRGFNQTRSTEENAQQQQAAELADKRRQKMAANVSVQSKGPSKKSVAPDDFDAAWDYYASKQG
jgi:hypothetical protein